MPNNGMKKKHIERIKQSTRVEGRRRKKCNTDIYKKKMCIKHDVKMLLVVYMVEKKLMLYNYETIKNPLASKCFHSLMFIHQKVRVIIIRRSTMAATKEYCNCPQKRKSH